MVGVLGDVVDRGGGHGGDARFHVSGSAPIEVAVDFGQNERVGVPGFEGSGRDDIHVTGEADVWFLDSVGGVEGEEVVGLEDLGLEVVLLEEAFEDVNGSGVTGGEGWDCDEGFEELARGHDWDSM